MKRMISLLYATVLTECIPLCAQRTVSVNLDPETRYQKIDGFGGCGMNGQWADVYTQEQVDRLWGPDGMGYNIMRIRINPDESNWKCHRFCQPVDTSLPFQGRCRTDVGRIL